MRVSRNKVDFVTLSSSGFPSANDLPNGSTLHFIDVEPGEDDRYVALNGVWEVDSSASNGT